VAFDLSGEMEKTARFVLIDNYEIAGCGIVLDSAEEHDSLLTRRVQQREQAWTKGYITPGERATQYLHKGKFVVFVGGARNGTHELAQKLELKLFLERAHTYYLSLSHVFEGLGESGSGESMSRERHLEQLGEMARIMTDAGLLFITVLAGVDAFDLQKLKLLNEPNELFVVQVGEAELGGYRPQVALAANPNINAALAKIVQALNASGVLPEYTI
jgi:bifunctional enzyme CysN/CysC